MDKSKKTIRVNGQEYPFAPTMGALLQYEHETGRSATHVSSESLTDMCTLLWCCVASACRREGLAFNLSLEEFGDAITVEDLLSWAESHLHDASSAKPAGKNKDAGKKKKA